MAELPSLGIMTVEVQHVLHSAGSISTDDPKEQALDQERLRNLIVEIRELARSYGFSVEDIHSIQSHNPRRGHLPEVKISLVQLPEELVAALEAAKSRKAGEEPLQKAARTYDLRERV